MKKIITLLITLVIITQSISPIFVAFAEETALPEIHTIDQNTESQSVEILNEDEEDTVLDLGNDQTEVDAKKDFTAVVRQTKDYYCGPAALATLLTQLGDNTSEKEVLDLIPSSDLDEEKGTNFLALKNAAQKLTANNIYLKKWSSSEVLEHITQTQDPVLIHDEKKNVGGHFSVIREYNKEKGIVELSDTEAGNVAYSVSDFEHIYTGSAFVISDVNPSGADISDEEAATIWGKYVPVYIAAVSVDGADVRTQNAVNAFKTCTSNAMKITVLVTRNSARAVCYTNLGIALKDPLSNFEELKLKSIVDGSVLLGNLNKENEVGVGTVDLLNSLRQVLASQTSYNIENPIYTSLLSLGGGSINNLSIFKSQLDTINTKISGYNSDVVILNTALATKQSSYNDTNSKINSGSFIQNGVTYSLGGVGSQITAQSATLNKLSSNLSSKLASIDSQIASVARQISSAQSSTNSYTNQANTYTSQASSAYSNYNYYKSKKGYTSTANSYYNQYLSFLNQSNTARSNAEYFKNQLTTYQAQIASLQTQKTSAQNEVNNASIELAKAQRLKDFGNQEIQRLKSILSVLQSDISLLKSQIISKTTVLNNYKSSNQSTIVSLTDKIAKLISAQSYESKLVIYKNNIDTTKSRYGFSTITYTNTVETQNLINQELLFEKTQDLKALDTATAQVSNDINNVIPNALTFIKNNPGKSAQVAGLTLVMVGGYVLCIPSEGVTCAVAVVSMNIMGGIFTANSIKVLTTGSNLLNITVSDQDYAQTLVMLPLDIAYIFGTGVQLKAALVSKYGEETSANLIRLMKYTSGDTKAIAETEIKTLAQTLKQIANQKVISLFRNASTIEDIKLIAEVSRINPSSESAIIMTGTYEAAQGVVDGLKAKGWRVVLDTKPSYAKDGSQIFNYISPDGLQSINLRSYSSSTAEVAAKGLEHKATIDLMKKVENDFKPWKEIKFTLPK